MALAAVLSLAISILKFGPLVMTIASGYIAAGIAVAAYALGFCARDRVTALTAGLLMAVSVGVTLERPADAVFTLMALIALTAHVAQKPLAGLVIAGLATALRLDAILLGLVLVAVLLTERVYRTDIVLSVFAAAALAGEVAHFAVCRHLTPMPQPDPNISALSYFFTGGAALIGWFIFPFLADLAEPARRTRWKPVFSWTAVLALVTSCATVRFAVPYVLLEPYMIVMAAAGFARILPVIASDAVRPRHRYVLAIAAAICLAVPKAYSDWTTTRPSLLIVSIAHETARTEQKPAQSPSKKPGSKSGSEAVNGANSGAAPPAIPKHVVAVSAAHLKKATPPAPAGNAPAAIVAQAVKLGIPISHRDWRGRTVPRNVWAIQWDIKAKQAAIAAKGGSGHP